MIPQSAAKMFLASDRIHTETGWFRSYSTFRSSSGDETSKESLGALYALEEITLAAGKSFPLKIERDTDLILLPVAGGISCKDGYGHEVYIAAGEVRVFHARKDSLYYIENLFKEELVNFLQLRMKASRGVASAGIDAIEFDLGTNINKVVPLITDHHQKPNYKTSIGKFQGREEAIIPIAKGNGLLVFVVEGAFEVQYRLLESRDALALWNEEKVEVEALSNGAIILFVEVAMG